MTRSAPGPVPDIAMMRDAVSAAYPHLAGIGFEVLTAGWDSVALDGGGMIFKFPRDTAHEDALKREARLLEIIRPAVTMTLPVMTIHDGPPLFSSHSKLPGAHLLTEQYRRLETAPRDALAEAMAEFYAQLHAMDQAPFAEAGASPLKGWLTAAPETILARAWPKLPDELRPHAKRIAGAWDALPDDPLGTIFGYFDGHGWNMAFDHAAKRLNGIYDMGDAGFGPLHAEFIAPNWIERDLTSRIAWRYERLTGRAVDPMRVETLTGAMRLSELAQQDEQPWRDRAVRVLAEWAGLRG